MNEKPAEEAILEIAAKIAQEGVTPNEVSVHPDHLGPLSGLPPTDPQGPLRRPPAYYAGQGTIKGKPIVHPETMTRADGTYGKKNKAARRMIRAKMKKSRSSVEKGVQYAQDLRQQAYTLSNNGHDARRILAKELALHEPAPEPEKRQRPIAAVQRHISAAVDLAVAAVHTEGKKEDK